MERRDRIKSRAGTDSAIKGGGLLTIKKDSGINIIQINDLDLESDNTTEVLKVKIIWKGSMFVISNICIPPIAKCAADHRIQRFTADNVFNKCLTSCEFSHHTIAGDMNAHNAIWDQNIKDDNIGTDILEWALENSISIANTGKATFCSKSSTKIQSSPDITLSTNGISVSQWKLLKPTSSDHLPIHFLVCAVKAGES